MFDRRAVAGYVVILFLGAALAVLVHLKAQEDLSVARANYRVAAQDRAQDVVRSIEVSLTQIYRNLRTISLLPSVRRIDRHGASLDEDARSSIQQLYNNLASAVAVSEVYIVPESLDSGRVDPATGRAEEPILMFDRLIVDAGAHKSDQEPFAGDEGNAHVVTRVDDRPTASGELPQEEKSHEYRLLREQMAWLRDHYPDTSTVDGMKLPFIGGREVITGDNTEFIRTGNDADRSGLILSVPFFGLDGKLKGTISATILTGKIKAMLPRVDYVLMNPGYGYRAASLKGGQTAASAAWIDAVQPDPALPYSAALPLELNDPRGKWMLWVGHPAADFLERSSVRAIESFRQLGYVFTACLTGLMLAVWGMLRQNVRGIERHNAALAQGIAERTQELTQTNGRLRHEMDGHRRTTEALRRALVASEAGNRAKTAFLSNVSHELRTPLNAIIGFSEIIRDELVGPIGRPEYREYAGHILEGGQRLLTAIDGILTLTRHGEPDPGFADTPFDLPALIERCVERAVPAAAARNVSLACTLDDAPQFVQGDEPGLAYALDALISNGIKFNREGGRVEVSVQRSPNGALRILVADTGVGIAAANLETVLNAMTPLDQSLTRSQEGLGLGLPAAKLIAEAHGGTLEIASTPGAGTRVAVVLPAARIRPVAVAELALSA
jgi:signal transduction histidine kinase